MFRHRSLLFTACACIVFAAGCDQNAPTATAPTAQDAATAETPAKPSSPVEAINPAIVLAATPNPADFCSDSKLTTVTVNWDVSAANVPMYSIWVEAPTVARKAWVSGSKPSESRATGPWVRENTKFTMTDSAGTIIASTTVTGTECGAAATAPAETEAPAPAAG